MGINLAMTRDYGRATPGQRVMDTKPSKRGENLSVIGALGYQERMLATLSLPGAVDGEAYLVFIKEVLAPRLRVGQIVFMDNVAMHKMKEIEKAIKAVGARVIFLPTYSPDLSPIENCWSKIKAFLRGVRARTRDKLETALSNALVTITQDDVVGWFAHCGYVDALK